MGLELSKELIKINELVGEDFSQTLVEGDIIVPDVKPDIARILQVDGIATITDKQVQQDRVVVNGVVNFKILYVPDDASETIKSICTNSNFSNTIEINSTDSNMQAQVDSDVEHIEFDMINSRKLNIKAVVGMNCKVINTPSMDFVTDIAGEEVQVLKKTIKAYNIVARNESEFIIKEELEIPTGKPSVKDLLKVDVKITDKDVKVIHNKIIVKGELNVCSLYVGETEENAIQFMEHEVLFTEILDLDGVTESMHCEVDYNLQDVYFQLKEDSDGDVRILNIENTLSVSASASEKVSVDVVVDTYSPESFVKVEKNTYNIDEIVADNKTQTTIKEVLSMPADIPEIVQVYNVITKPYITETKVEVDRIIVEGMIDTYILYLSESEESPVYSYKQEVPFVHNIDVKGAVPEMACDVKVEVDHANYSLNAASEVEIRYIIGVLSRVIKTTQVELVTKADVEAADIANVRSVPSIVMYFVQKGDTLWEIAKKYYTTVQEIANTNNLDETHGLSPGQQLLIPKRKRKCS
ncbi:MAG: DUF3794 domain-containing protein [Firmicutes bacterium]|nr:DUF3794 domain-containing protein [Bacillota bacterium]